MKIFFKNIRSFNFNLQYNKPNFQNIITKLFSSKKGNLLNINASPAKNEAKKTVKKSKNLKNSKKNAIEEMIEQEATEVPKEEVSQPIKTKKVSKSKKSKLVIEEVAKDENVKNKIKEKKPKKEKENSKKVIEQENIKKNVRAKNKNKEELPLEKTQLSDNHTIKIENIKLGNHKANSPINYDLNMETNENPYENYIQNEATQLTKSYILKERTFSCYNYAPLPVVLESGQGIYVKDVDKNTYIDFLAGYSSLNFGHCNTDILNSVIPFMSTLHMTSRAFHNTLLGNVSKLLTNLFDMDKVLYMNSGVEAGESAVKFARRWGYKKKNIPDGNAEIIFFKGNFWGRSIAACGSSDDKSRYSNFGPFGGLGFHLIPYNNVEALEITLKENPNVCGLMIEPIQGENGVVIPAEDYLNKVRQLCNKYNVLMIVDEIQTGLGRGTGNISICRSKNIKPDMILLGKSLSGGFYPVSAVIGSNEVIDLIRPGDHGSTYGGNPLALRFVYSTLNYITSGNIIISVNIKEGMLSTFLKIKSKFIKEIRGRGLLFAIEFFEDSPVTAYKASLYLMERGILCKPTKSNILRLSPPIIITEKELFLSGNIIFNVLKQLETLHPTYSAPHDTKYNFAIVSKEAVLAVQEIKKKNVPSNEEYLQHILKDEQVKHESIVEQVQHESIIERVKHESIVEQVENESKVEQVENLSKVEQVQHESKVEQVENQSKVEQVENQSKVEQVENQSKVEQVENQFKVEQVENLSKVEQVQHESKLEQVENLSKVEQVQHESKLKQEENQSKLEQGHENSLQDDKKQENHQDQRTNLNNLEINTEIKENKVNIPNTQTNQNENTNSIKLSHESSNNLNESPNQNSKEEFAQEPKLIDFFEINNYTDIGEKSKHNKV